MAAIPICRVCQEYGRQPCWYNVRDAIPGSDWRSDGGWAIVLVSSSAASYTFVTVSFATGQTLPFDLELATPVLRTKTQVTDSSRGLTGFIICHSDSGFTERVVINRDNNGEIDAGDRSAGPSNNLWELYTYTSAVYGTRYIRWSDMQWCH